MTVLVNALGSDVFNTVNMTTAINKLPVMPTFIGDMNLFTQIPSPTVGIQIEERRGVLALIPATQRGYGGRSDVREVRVVSAVYNCVHLETFSEVLAEASQGVRAFGTTDQLEGPVEVVNQRMLTMKQNIDATLEWQRAGAIRGVLYDADGSTVLQNWFTNFSITEQVQDFAFTTSTTDIKQLCLNVIRLIGDSLGQTPFTGVTALCSDGWFDAFCAHPIVRAAMITANNVNFIAQQQGGAGQGVMNSFTLFGITWCNYRAVVGTNYMIPVNTCRFVPTGCRDLFQQYFAPADYVEAVNTMGKPYYSKRVALKWDKGWELEAQSNPLTVCTRPRCLIKGTKS